MVLASLDDGETQMTHELLDRRELTRRLNVSARTLDRMIQDGRLPRPIELRPRCRRWPSAQIDSWIETGCQPVDADSDQEKNHGI